MATFASKLASSILEMENELAELRREVVRLERIEARYHALLHSSIESQRNIHKGLLDIALAQAGLADESKEEPASKSG